ncbi:hypothetical protein [Anaerosporobacter sp.]
MNDIYLERIAISLEGINTKFEEFVDLYCVEHNLKTANNYRKNNMTFSEHVKQRIKECEERSNTIEKEQQSHATDHVAE